MATFDRSLVSSGDRNSSVHAGVINKLRQDSKRSVTSGSLYVITGPVDSALDLV